MKTRTCPSQWSRLEIAAYDRALILKGERVANSVTNAKQLPATLRYLQMITLKVFGTYAFIDETYPTYPWYTLENTHSIMWTAYNERAQLLQRPPPELPQ